MYDFFDSNLFQTIALTLVGLVAWFVYKKQKKDQLRNAASMIKLEIDNIEEAISRLMLTTISEDIYKTSPLYQSLEWYKVRNLFVGKIDIEHVNAVNKFYEMVIVCEDARNRMKEAVHLNRVDKIDHTQFQISHILAEQARTNPQNSAEQNIQEAAAIVLKYAEIYNDGRPAFDFIMNSVIAHLTTAMNSFTPISNTPAYEQIKKLTKNCLFF